MGPYRALYQDPWIHVLARWGVDLLTMKLSIPRVEANRAAGRRSSPVTRR